MKDHSHAHIPARECRAIQEYAKSRTSGNDVATVRANRVWHAQEPHHQDDLQFGKTEVGLVHTHAEVGLAAADGVLVYRAEFGGHLFMSNFFCAGMTEVE